MKTQDAAGEDQGCSTNVIHRVKKHMHPVTRVYKVVSEWLNISCLLWWSSHGGQSGDLNVFLGEVVTQNSMQIKFNPKEERMSITKYKLFDSK